MEEKKEIKISLTTFLLVIAIIVILIMGYVLFNLSTQKTGGVKEKELQQEVDTLKAQINNYEEQAVTNTENQNDNNENIKEELSNNSYSIYANNLIKRRNATTGEWYRSTKQMETGENITISIDNKGTAYLELTGELANKYGKKHKILENALMCKFIKFNQDVTDYLYFICEDGSVAVVSILTDIKTDTTSYKEYKNIINILTTLDTNVEGFEGTPIQKVKFVDIDGNIFDIN